MAEKDYDIWLAEAKAALDGYSAEQAEIAKLYEQAKQNAKDSLDAQKEKLYSQSRDAKSQAAADAKRTERNINQTLASRGLAFSGENAQTHLDVNLGLQNELASIDRDTGAQVQELQNEHNKTVTELDLAHAEARSANAQKRAELQSKLAEIASQKAQSQTQSQTSAEQAVEKDGTEDTEQSSIAMPNLKGKSLAERVRLMLEYVAQQKKESYTAYVPDISARDLAKQLITSAGTNGKVTDYEEQALLTTLLEALTEAHDFDADYYEELMLNLRSMGYRPDYTRDLQKEQTALIKQSQSVYSEKYKRYYAMYESFNMYAGDCDELASELATFEQLVYIYENSESTDRFEAAVAALHLEDELVGFYKRVRESEGKYVLGAAIERG